MLARRTPDDTLLGGAIFASPCARGYASFCTRLLVNDLERSGIAFALQKAAFDQSLQNPGDVLGCKRTI